MKEEKKVVSTKENMVPNEPNAAILIDALQNIGYDNISAITDIVDNSIDAGATKIQIQLENENEGLKIMIIDNGKGMTKETLDQALKLGSDTLHDGISDLGKFGMGLSTAGLALANKTTVFTRSIDENIIYKSMTDVNVIKKENAFVKLLCKADELDRIRFEHLVNYESGTIVILEDCIGIKQNEFSTLKGKIIKNLSRIFRKFMDRTEFWVNDTKINPDDPLRIGYDEFPGTLISEDDYDVKWKDIDGTEKHGTLHIKIASLPECPRPVANKLGMNMKNQGFSVLRNNREILFGYLPDWEGIARHNDLNRFRGEISFSSDMDFAMGVNFRKNGIDMVDSIDNALRGQISPQIKTVRKKYEIATETSDEEKEEHTLAQKIINKMSNTLTLPRVKKEIRETKEESNEPRKEKDDNQKSERTRTPIKTESINAVAEFELKHMGETGNIFETSQVGKKIIISWNIDHVFYKKFIAENVANENVVRFADFLIYTLASAQIQYMADDEEKLIIMDNIISTMSANIRNLLKN